MQNKIRAGAGWLIGAALGVALFPACAGAAPAEIRWNELAALIVGHQVKVPLAGGGVVEGQALSVRDDSLVIDIRKTPDSSRYPRGQTPISRASVTEVWIVEHRGTGGRILGTAVGALAGMIAGAEVAVHGTRSEAAGVSTFSAIAVACTAGGHYAGRRADRRSRRLGIAPVAATLPATSLTGH
jgi:uncharacterized protein YcfJ